MQTTHAPCKGAAVELHEQDYYGKMEFALSIVCVCIYSINHYQIVCFYRNAGKRYALKVIFYHHPLEMAWMFLLFEMRVAS